MWRYGRDQHQWSHCQQPDVQLGWNNVGAFENVGCQRDKRQAHPQDVGDDQYNRRGQE
jgi:hypothetical protein